MAIAILLLPKQYHRQPLPKMTATQNWVDGHTLQICRQAGDNNWPID
jgi:hypothetical protein